MLIDIHMIQNYAPNNLNRDDIGAPKTCWFGGVLRQRISSQALKRSIRRSPEFARLLGGVRTRRLAELIGRELPDDPKARARAEKILRMCGIVPKDSRGKSSESDDDVSETRESSALIYTSWSAIHEMASLLQDDSTKDDALLARRFAQLITGRTAVPDMALSGRMLEPKKAEKGIWDDLEKPVEASLQVMHAFSTHEARPEVDYYVAKDDVPGPDAGAGFVDEAMFSSACFYKYFSIHWESLVQNLVGYGEAHEKLAAHTVGAFLRAAAVVSPSGKQNSHAAHNRPDAILVELRDSPISYANAFAKPATEGARPGAVEGRDLISQSVAQLGQYVKDMDGGYDKPHERFWFSPNLRQQLVARTGDSEQALAKHNIGSLDELVRRVIREIGYDWEDVQQIGLLESDTK